MYVVVCDFWKVSVIRKPGWRKANAVITDQQYCQNKLYRAKELYFR